MPSWRNEIGQQLVDQFEKLCGIPWGHQILLIFKCHTVQEALFYINKTLENGWSLNSGRLKIFAYIGFYVII
ncbi:MAG TPA: hypothetical protein DC053_07575 [Lachnoclostridium sp.]|nr:hypothetical protein [Lachnoclostridium sp.]